MPNLYQLTFLATLTLTFSTLVLLFHFINAKLLDAGYDVSRLILIGLPDQPPPPPQRIAVFDNFLTNMSFFIPNDLHAVNIPMFGTLDIVVLASSPAFIFGAVIVVATAIYSSVFHTGWYLFSSPYIHFPIPS
jgi:cytochrome-b5 reductase